MSDAAIATREFDLDDQLWFASLSGDANPLHVDPVAARRTMLGECVVHGVHTVLWALDEYARSAKLKPCEIALLRVAFRRPVRLGQRVECHVERATGDSFELRVVDAAGGVFADIRVATRPATSADSGGRMGPLENVECADLDFDEAANVSGETRLSLDALTLEKRFGSLARTFPLLQTAEVLATTRIVGMFCPGRNSLFGAIKLESRHAEDAPQVVQYETERAEPRYSIIDVSVNGPTLSGTLNTFYRPPPQQQAGVNRAQDIVEQSEFEDNAPSSSAALVGSEK